MRILKWKIFKVICRNHGLWKAMIIFSTVWIKSRLGLIKPHVPIYDDVYYKGIKWLNKQ